MFNKQVSRPLKLLFVCGSCSVLRVSTQATTYLLIKFHNDLAFNPCGEAWSACLEGGTLLFSIRSMYYGFALDGVLGATAGVAVGQAVSLATLSPFLLKNEI